MKTMSRNVNFKQILDDAIKIVGIDNLYNVIIAIKTNEMLTDIFECGYLVENENNFNRICNYVKGVYMFTDYIDLKDIIYTVGTFLEWGDIDSLEDIDYGNFIDEVKIIMSA